MRTASGPVGILVEKLEAGSTCACGPERSKFGARSMKLLDGPSCETGLGSPSDSAPFEQRVHAKDQAVRRRLWSSTVRSKHSPIGARSVVNSPCLGYEETDCSSDCHERHGATCNFRGP